MPLELQTMNSLNKLNNTCLYSLQYTFINQSVHQLRSEKTIFHKDSPNQNGLQLQKAKKNQCF